MPKRTLEEKLATLSYSLPKLEEKIIALQSSIQKIDQEEELKTAHEELEEWITLFNRAKSFFQKHTCNATNIDPDELSGPSDTSQSLISTLELPVDEFFK